MRLRDQPRDCTTCRARTPHRETWTRCLLRLAGLSGGHWTCERCEHHARVARRRPMVLFFLGHVWRRP
jgi:hypothetical protein